MNFFLIFFIFIITENIYQRYVPGLNYFDEAITIIAGLLLLCNYKKTIYRQNHESKILRCTFIIILIGACSSIIYKIQPEFSGIWRDALAIVKFPICYCGLTLFMRKHKFSQSQESVIIFCRMYLSILLVCGLYNLFHYSPELSNGMRYGFPLYSFLYTHNTFLVVAVLSMLSILLSDGMKRNKIYILFGLLVLVLTFRSKAFVPVIFIVLSYMWTNSKRRIKHVKIRLAFGLVLVAALAIYFSRGRVEDYISYGDTSVRGAFYIFGFDIASEYFPLGSGFCTFASTLSAEYYSPLYYSFGMNIMSGLTEDDHSYAGDVFWPNIYAQYGYLGLAVYV